MEVDKNDIDEKRIAELRELLGLNKNETPKSTLFQGDFGTSIHFDIVIPLLIIFSAVAFLLFFMLKRRKSKS